MYYGNQPGGFYPSYNGYQYMNPTNQFTSVQTPPPVQQQQQQQVVQQQPLIYGKIVDGIEVVKSYDVPIGSTFIFPRADEATIYSKGWNSNGTTYVKEYRLFEESTDSEVKINWEEKLDEIYSSISNLNKKIDALNKKSSSTPPRKKWEVEEDDE